MKRLADWLASAPFTLAMSSGFFGFFAHTGVLSTLVEAGLRPRAVSGSSAGALVGGAYAAGLEPQDLATALTALDRDSFWDPRVGFGLLAGKKFDALLRRLLPTTRIEATRVPAAISVFDILRARTRVLTAGDLPDAIRASCAVPGMFHPVWIERRPYWDGGVLDRPGIAGLAPRERVLYHHLVSRGVKVPHRPGLIALLIPDLPASGPFKLDDGKRAMLLAKEAAKRALDLDVTLCEEQQTSLTSRA